MFIYNPLYIIGVIGMAEVSYGGGIVEDVRWIKNILTNYPNDPKTHKLVREFIKTHHIGSDRVRFLDALFGDAEIRSTLRRGTKHLDRAPVPSR